MTGQPRSCGSCSLCCKTMSVAAIPKGRWEWCPHVSRSGGGCRIYEDRPAACRDWSCAWLRGDGAFPATERPDSTGFVASLEARGEVHLHEDRPGVLDGGQACATVERLLARGATVVSWRRDGRMEVAGPGSDDVRRRFARAARRRRRGVGPAS